MLTLCLMASLGFAMPPRQTPVYKNPLMPVERRVEDLLKRMTLEEKLNQVRCDIREEIYKPALATTGFGEVYDVLVPLDARQSAEKANELQQIAMKSRLGIPLMIHNEALHGLVVNGATSFPQAIGLAATWDPDLMGDVAGAIADEAKARGTRRVLSPVINVVRDARWGRVEETYGEDPVLTSRMGVAFVKAFETRGVCTTPKHFVDNVGDGGRDSHAIHIDEQSLREVYLPPFEAVVRQGGARSIMTAYNSLNGRACTANHWLLTDLLKHEYGFTGLVGSDYGATDGILGAHHNAEDPEDAAAQALNAGLDMEWPNVYIWGKPLEAALHDGKTSMKALDDAVRRILRNKFEIGLFENPLVDPDMAEKVVQSDEHKRLALKAAREAIVLLKNQSDLLPLKKDLKSIALIGPSANSPMPLGGYSGYNIPTVSVMQGLKDKLGDSVKIEWTKGSSYKNAEEMPTIEPSGFVGLTAEYFANRHFSGAPALTRSESKIDFDVDRDTVATNFPKNDISVRWTGKLVAPKTGDYTFTTTSDDGVRLTVGGRRLIDDWSEHAPVTDKTTVHLEAGMPVDFTLEYFQAAGGGVIRLGWGLPGRESTAIQDAVDLAKRSDVAIVVAGIREGEGQDRAFLDLPGDQEELIRQVSATGTPTVVVLIAGAPVTMTHWIDGVGAVVDAWYPGQQGGTALADVLFGDVNPGAKLPITFPRSVGQCPIYYNLQPSGRGYDYVDLTGQPEFPFGFGLSYTKFSYANLSITPNASASGPFVVSFDVTNTGQVAGDEVPQLYVRDVVASMVRPLKELKDFKRIHLAPGETRKVSFSLSRDELAFYNAAMKKVTEPGQFRVMIGSSSADIRLDGSFELK